MHWPSGTRKSSLWTRPPAFQVFISQLNTTALFVWVWDDSLFVWGFPLPLSPLAQCRTHGETLTPGPSKPSHAFQEPQEEEVVEEEKEEAEQMAPEEEEPLVVGVARVMVDYIQQQFGLLSYCGFCVVHVFIFVWYVCSKH